MRILHINDYPVETGGGAEVVMGNTMELLRRRGLAVEAFTSADLDEPHWTPLRYVDNARARRALAAKLEAFRPDVVHLHNYYHLLSPGILATLEHHKRQLPLRVVMTAHDYHLACPNSGGCWFRRWTGRREVIAPRAWSLGAQLARRWDHRGPAYALLKVLQHAWNYRWHHRQQVIDLVICPSRFVQALVAPTGLQTSWLPHPVPPLPAAVSARPGILSLVYAGRIEEPKGLEGMLRMVPADFPAVLTVIGAGERLAICREICARRGLAGRVHFVGRLSHAETIARIAACHALVQPSRQLETYGLTLIEALAVGTNVLATDRGASREIVEDTGVGFLYDVEDPHSLAAALQKIARSHVAGTLNRFDLSRFLKQRSPCEHIDALLRLYEPPELQNAAAA